MQTLEFKNQKKTRMTALILTIGIHLLAVFVLVATTTPDYKTKMVKMFKKAETESVTEVGP